MGHMSQKRKVDRHDDSTTIARRQERPTDTNVGRSLVFRAQGIEIQHDDDDRGNSDDDGDSSTTATEAHCYVLRRNRSQSLVINSRAIF